MPLIEPCFHLAVDAAAEEADSHRECKEEAGNIMETQIFKQVGAAVAADTNVLPAGGAVSRVILKTIVERKRPESLEGCHSLKQTWWLKPNRIQLSLWYT